MTTRGVRKIKEYLGEDAASAVRAKRAVDVVPVLSARKAAAATTGSRLSPASGVSPNVTAYLHECQAAHGNDVVSNKLEKKQLQTIAALSTLTPLADDGSTTLSVKRVVQATRRAMVNVVAVSALERTEQYMTAEASSTLTPTEKAQLPGTSLFVLADSDALATYLASALEKDFGLHLLALIGSEKTPRHPSFPLENTATAGAGSAATPKGKASKKQAKAQPGKQVHFDGNETPSPLLLSSATLASRTCVVVATLDGFLTVDKRSAIWKHIGAAVVAVEGAPATSELLKTLAADATRCHDLAAHREACLSHVPLLCVVAASQESLVAPQLDWLTTLQPGSAATPSSNAKAAATTAGQEVAIHYAVSQGVHRFQFLFGLLKGLVPHRGVVVHVATKEACTFLYDALYAFLDSELPRHMQILTDYEGTSSYSRIQSADDLEKLSEEFDTIVDPANHGEKTAAVLISCHGLIPRRGSVYLAYDLIVDVPNFPRLVAERLVPATTAGAAAPPAVRKRGRSTSPSPTPSRSAQPKTESKTTTPTTTASPALVTPHYQFVIVLLRPNEVKGVQHHLQGASTAGVRLSLSRIDKPGTELRHMFIGEKLQTMNRTLFAIQNAAYAAYRATMTAYCTMGPRDVYNEKAVDLASVAAEFGYTDLPLLDLRLKDTVFRPKEDYFKAAKQKMTKDQKQYKRFADENIIGVKPEDHMADA